MSLLTKFFKNVDEVTLFWTEVPPSDGLKDALEGIEIGRLVVFESLTQRRQAGARILLMQRIHEEIVHLSGGLALVSRLFPAIQPSQRLVVVGIFQAREALPFGGLLDGPQHSGLKVVAGAVTAERDQIPPVTAPVLQLLGAVRILLGVVGKELLHLRRIGLEVEVVSQHQEEVRLAGPVAAT